jgi:hypothetical protein
MLEDVFLLLSPRQTGRGNATTGAMFDLTTAFVQIVNNHLIIPIKVGNVLVLSDVNPATAFCVLSDHEELGCVWHTKLRVGEILALDKLPSSLGILALSVGSRGGIRVLIFRVGILVELDEIRSFAIIAF